MEQKAKNILLLSGATLGVLLVISSNKKKIKNMLSPVIARISSPFGKRKATGSSPEEFHNGVDLAVPIGTPIKASANGEILHVYKNERGGLQLTAKLENGFIVGYAHLSKTIFKDGEKFSKGDILALSGTSGHSTGPHLHFTLKDAKGTPLNPQDYFSFA